MKEKKPEALLENSERRNWNPIRITFLAKKKRKRDIQSNEKKKIFKKAKSKEEREKEKEPQDPNPTHNDFRLKEKIVNLLFFF